jgi:protein-disulfide isomerase
MLLRFLRLRLLSVPMTRRGRRGVCVRRARALLVAGALLAAAAVPARADSITQAQADEILKELRQIRQLLEKLTTSPIPPVAAPRDDRVTLPSVRGYMLGRPDAPLTLVEFTDLQCPYCRKFHADTYDELMRNYIDTGKLRFVTRDLPLESLHPQAMRAALAARCAGEQGKFWELRQALALDATLSPESMTASAARLGLDVIALQKCVDERRFEADVRKDVAEAAAVGISGTPTFVVGRTSGDGLQGVKIVGAQPYATFDARLRKLLEAAPAH